MARVISIFASPRFRGSLSSLRDLAVIRARVPGLKAGAIFGSPFGTMQN